MMKTKRSRILIISGLITILLGTSLPAQANNTSPKGDLILARNQDFATFDPDLAQNDSIFIQQQIFEPLFMINQDGKGVRPWLAKKYSISGDKLTWTIKLRTDVKFSNGQQMTSKDVKFSLDTAAKGNGWGFLLTAVKSVSAPSPDTVVIKTKTAWAPLISDLAAFSTAIFPVNYGGVTKEKFMKNPVGTGPFKFDHWTPGTEIKFVANKDYWQPGKPYLNSVTWKYVVDDNTRELQLKAGQIDINEFPPATTFNRLIKTPGITGSAFSAAASQYIAFNHKVPALADVHVRRAISMALDRAAIIKVVLAGLGKPSNSIMAPNVGFYDPKTPGLQYDLSAAKAELAKSKYAKGLKLNYLGTSGNVEDTAMSQILQASLAKIGIKLTITNQEPKVKRQTQKEMKYQITSTAWTMDISDPDELLTFALDYKNGGSFAFYTNYNNQKVIDLVAKGQVTTDSAARQIIYTKVQKIVADDAVMMYAYNAPYIYAWRNKITGFQVTPTLQYHMENVKKN